MKCPGQDPRFWKFDAIFEAECPKCGNQIEFFKDETKRRCKKCGHQVLNPKMDFGCAAHCKFAEHCFGELPPELVKQKQDLFKDRVAVEMKLYFHQDFKRIGHSAKVARYAEKLVEKEKGDPAVVLTAAYLHDIGIREAERKHESVDAAYQELEGPAIAREILTKLDAAEPLVDEVCDIIGHHHHPRDDETMNFKIVYDADLLSNLEEKHKKSNMEPQRLIELIESEFLTRSGKELAHEILFNGETPHSGMPFPGNAGLPCSQ
ncbi:MAG: HD domain-containing protein [Desulfomonilaceae bacterium]